MKILRTLFAALLAAVSVATALAADATPAGTWKWTANGPQGPLQIQARLEAKDGAVTGAIITPGGELPISEGTFKDGMVNYIVVREIRGEKLRVKYSGKLEGDTLTGTIDRPLPGSDEHQVVDWKATRTP